MFTGMAGWISLLLFLTGLILCFLEILCCSFGFFALGGIGCMIGSIVFVTPDFETAIKYITIVLLLVLAATPVFIKLFSKTKTSRKLLVEDRLTSEAGYIATDLSLAYYIDKYGTALTDLRPSGIVEAEDGKRLNVISNGEFIEKGESVHIIQLEGTWMIVEKRRDA